MSLVWIGGSNSGLYWSQRILLPLRSWHALGISRLHYGHMSYTLFFAGAEQHPFAPKSKHAFGIPCLHGLQAKTLFLPLAWESHLMQ